MIALSASRSKDTASGAIFPPMSGANLFIVDADGAHLRQLTDGEPLQSDQLVDYLAPGWSTDGQTLIFQHTLRNKPFNSSLLAVTPENLTPTAISTEEARAHGYQHWSEQGDRQVLYPEVELVANDEPTAPPHAAAQTTLRLTTTDEAGIQAAHVFALPTQMDTIT